MDEFHVDSIHQALLVVVKTYIINIVLALSLNGKNIIVWILKLSDHMLMSFMRIQCLN